MAATPADAHLGRDAGTALVNGHHLHRSGKAARRAQFRREPASR